jgi:hypothetical protein
VLSYDVELEALRMLVDRREELTRQRVRRPTLSTSIPSLRPLTDAHQLARPTSRLAHTTRVLSTENTRNGSA